MLNEEEMQHFVPASANHVSLTQHDILGGIPVIKIIPFCFDLKYFFLVFQLKPQNQGTQFSSSAALLRYSTQTGVPNKPVCSLFPPDFTRGGVSVAPAVCAH